MNWTDIFDSDTVVAVIAALVGAAWTFIKSTEWFAAQRGQRLDRAVAALEAGVDHTYRTYVAAVKAGHADGKLTEDERRQARELALKAALEFGRTRGIDVLREIGPEYVDVWIAKLVKHLKRQSS